MEAFLIERKMDNCKPCGGAIPICMVEEFDLPMEIIDRRVTKMKMISPSNREVDVGKTLNDKEWIGMCRREVFDDFLRKRATKLGANLVNGLYMGMDVGADTITIRYNEYKEGELSRETASEQLVSQAPARGVSGWVLAVAATLCFACVAAAALPGS